MNEASEQRMVNMSRTRAEHGKRTASFSLESVRTTYSSDPSRFTAWQSSYRLRNTTFALALHLQRTVLIGIAACDRLPEQRVASK